MKIAIVSPFYPSPEEPNAGGIGNHFQHLALGFREAGHEVEVFQFPYVCAADSVFEHDGVPVHQFGLTPPAWFQARGLGRLARLTGYVDRYPSKRLRRRTCEVLAGRIQGGGFEVIESTSNRGLPLSYCERVRKRLPVFTRVSTTMALHFKENQESPDFNQRKECEYERGTIAMSDALVTHTRAHAAELESELGVDARQFHIIPHGIDIPPPPANPQGGMDEEEAKVLYVGRFESRKGADVLLEAVPRVLAKHPATRFLLAGLDKDGAYERGFKEAHGADVLRQVEFLGAVTDEERTGLYRACDLFVAPSRYESFGIVYAEAMSFGKPVVGCDAGGAPEVIGEKAGLLARPGDPADLAERILELCQDRERCVQMGRDAYDRASTLFSREKMARDTVDLYRQVLAGRN